MRACVQVICLGMWFQGQVWGMRLWHREGGKPTQADSHRASQRCEPLLRLTWLSRTLTGVSLNQLRTSCLKRGMASQLSPELADAVGKKWLPAVASPPWASVFPGPVIPYHAQALWCWYASVVNVLLIIIPMESVSLNYSICFHMRRKSCIMSLKCDRFWFPTYISSKRFT